MNSHPSNEQDKAPPPKSKDDPAILLTQGLSRLVELEHEHSEHEMARQVAPLLRDMRQIQTVQQQSLHQLQNLQKQFGDFLTTNRVLEEASQQNRILSDQHYEDHVISPMVRGLFPIFDIVYDAVASDEHAAKLNSRQFAGFAGALWTQLEQFVLQYDVKVICDPPHTRFQAQTMKPVKTLATDNKSWDGLVASCLQVGFRKGPRRLLRPETVSLYKYRPSQLETRTSEGGQNNEYSRS